jgi:hypothetical protein
MTIVINVVTETQLDGERIRRFKGSDPEVLLTEVKNYLAYAVPGKPKKVEPKKVSPAQDMRPTPKPQPKPQPKVVRKPSKAKKR